MACMPTESAFSLPKTPTLEDLKRTKLSNNNNLHITIKIDGVQFKSIDGPLSSTSLSRSSVYDEESDDEEASESEGEEIYKRRKCHQDSEHRNHSSFFQEISMNSNQYPLSFPKAD